ncbi:glycosyltransferase [bacterium]|nr:glycosyltransferase [bacterium]
MDHIIKLQNHLAQGANLSSLNTSSGVEGNNPGGFSLYRQRPRVSVIIPTLNEAKNLPLVLPYLPMAWIDEVILVDGRSTDNTVEVAQTLLPSIIIVMEQKKGKGAAMNAGYHAATGEILIVVDADGSNDPREIPRFVQALMLGSDMVKGSRFSHGAGTTDMPFIRQMGNAFFTISCNVLFGTHWTDLCYGYHAFWRHCLEVVDVSDTPGFEIDTALYLRAAREQLHVTEVPSFEGYRFFGVGKLQTIPDGWRVLKTIVRERLKKHRTAESNRYLGFRGLKPVMEYEPSPHELPITAPEINMQLLRTIGMILSAGYSLNDLMTQVLHLSLQAMNAVSGSLLILDEKGQVADSCVVYGDKKVKSSAQSMTEVLEQGVAGWVLRNRKLALIANTNEDPRWLPRTWEQDMPRSAIAVPVALTDNRFGILTLVRAEQNSFSLDDIKMLESLSIPA